MLASIAIFASLAAGQMMPSNIHQFGLPISWSPYLAGSISAESKTAFYLLNNDAQWQSYWSRESGQPLGSAPRDINWGTDQLIAIHLGERRSGGYAGYVASILRTDPANALITVYEKFPVANQIVTQEITHPYVIVKVKRTAARYRYTIQADPASAMGGINFLGSGSIIIPGNPNGGGGGSCNCGGNCTCGCSCGSGGGNVIISGPIIVNGGDGR